MLAWARAEAPCLPALLLFGREAMSPVAPAEPKLSCASAVVAVSDWLLFVGLLWLPSPGSSGLWWLPGTTEGPKKGGNKATNTAKLRSR